MKLSLIVAMDERRLIGSMSGGLPWQGIERDREHFRSYVKGKALLLGRKTYEEMEGWLDSNHRAYILTRNRNYVPKTSVRVAVGFFWGISRGGKDREREGGGCGGGGMFGRALK